MFFLLLLSDSLEDLGLLDTNDAVSLVLTLLALLTRSLGLLEEADAGTAVTGLEGLEGLLVVVDQTETGGLATTKVGLEAEHLDELLVRQFVHLGQLLAELLLGDGATTRVDDIQNLCSPASHVASVTTTSNNHKSVNFSSHSCSFLR